MIAVSYKIKWKIKNISLEVISNTKIFYIKFWSMKLLTTKILPNLQGGLDKGRRRDKVEYSKYNIRKHIINCINVPQKPDIILEVLMIVLKQFIKLMSQYYLLSLNNFF